MPLAMALVLVDGGFDHSYGLAATVFGVAAASDFVDGYLARRWEVTSTLGAFLDSVADKLLVTGVLFALVEVGRAWAWAAFVIVGREIAITALRSVAALRGTMVPPSVLGKLKANVQYLAVGFAILRFSGEPGGLHVDQWWMLAAVVVTVVSGAEYVARFRQVLRPATSRP